MSDIIKHGIDKANEDLKKENEQKMIQEVKVLLMFKK